MKKTKIFSCVFAVITMMLLFIMSASAAEKTYTSGNYKYTVTDGEATIVEYTSTKSTDLIIPKTLGGYPVTEIGYSAFYKTKLNSVTLPSTLKKIGDLAFDGSKIKKVTFNDGLEYIGFRAFWECDELTEIVLPDSVTEVGKGAFSYCDNLKTVTLSNNLASISQGMFHDSIKLEAIVIPDSVKTIEMNAFYGCYGLKSVKFGENVESIGDQAFVHCGMETLALPDGLKTVGSHAFDDCYALEHISMGTAVESIGYDCFQNNYPTNLYYEGTREEWYEKVKIDGSTVGFPPLYWDHKHEYSKYVSDKNATYKADGTKTAICDNGCHRTDTVTDKGTMLPLSTTSKLTFTCATESITLKWSAVEGAGGYRVFVKNTATGKWDIAVRTTGKKTTATIDGLESGKKYTFAVRAYVNNGSIVWAPKYKSVSAVTRPGVTEKVTATAGDEWIRINWSKVPGATGYRVYVLRNGAWKALKTTTGLFYYLMDVEEGKEYTLAVKAYTKLDDTAHWAAKYAKISGVSKPESPDDVKAKSATRNSVTISWEKVDYATGYRVYIYNTETGKWDTAVRNTTKLTATVDGLSSNESYTLAVRAYIKHGTSYIWGEGYSRVNVKTAK